MSAQSMTLVERRATYTLSAILSMRMLGLFMVLPLFALYTKQLNATTPFLSGLAVGIYGLTQAFFQIPLGLCSDYFGRKKIILFGLLLFIGGSLLAAISSNIYTMILGRALQGAGAIGSTIMALLSDLTRENQRTKALATAGVSIGFSFTLAMIVGPMLMLLTGVKGMFWLAAFFGLVAIFLLVKRVPTPPTLPGKSTTWTITALSAALSTHLLRLYISIFALHAIFTATFIALPINLDNLAGIKESQQWEIFSPALFIAFCLSIPMIIIAEKRKQIRKTFLISIIALAVAELLFSFFPANCFYSFSALVLFFAGFSTLEALLPSLVSKTVNPSLRGSAMGIYSCAQFTGIFIGGLLGSKSLEKGVHILNYLNLHTTTYILCFTLSLFWIPIALGIHKKTSPQI